MDAPPPPPPPPAAPPPAASSPDPWSQPGTTGWSGPPPGAQRPTNSLSVISLVFGCAQFVVCPVVGAIVAVVTGHISRGQIKRRNEQGAGMALAGLILGYIGIVFTVLVLAGGLVFILGFSGEVAQHVVRDDARDFANSVVRSEIFEHRTTPRDPQFLTATYLRENATNGCCTDDDISLADGTPITSATRADWIRNEWRIEFRRSIFHERRACFTVPATASDVVRIVDGACTSDGQ
ncbi:MAG TPA: DUF4190 domain-containing protein [Acidimicrobiia bacterium]|jgi:hypothetical protein|nr:DUF4190 domain-containing protein [Acidimicrobiia bacterium]